MYHAVLAAGDSGEGLDPQDRAYAVGREDWRAQLDLIQAAPQFAPAPPATFITAAARAEERCSPAKESSPVAPHESSGYDEYEIALTFDDAWAGHLEVAAPELQSRALGGLFFITTGQVGQPHMLTWEGVRELADMGFTIGSHGGSHRFFTGLPEAELRQELRQSKQELEAKIGRLVTLLSLPGGRGNARVAAAAERAGYALIFGSRPGLWESPREPGPGAAAPGPIPRLVMRAGAAGTESLRRLLAAPESELIRRQRQARWRELLQRLAGDRLYHALHRLLMLSRPT